MPSFNEEQLKAQLKSGAFSGAYLFYGDESYLKSYYVGKMKKQLINPSLEDFNYFYYEEKNATLDNILMDCNQLPFMSEHTMVLVRDYAFDSDKDEEKLSAYFENMSETTVLVFWCDSVELDLKKNKKHSRLVRLFAEHGAAVALNQRSFAEVVRLVQAKAKKSGCLIDRNDANYLVKTVGTDIHTVFNELGKICAYVGNGTITKKEIDLLAVPSVQSRVFDLSKFIFAKNGEAAFRLLRDLFNQKERPEGLLTILSSCYIDIYRAKLAKQERIPNSELLGLFNYKGREFLLDTANQRTSNISMDALRKALDLLSDAEIKMKSFSLNKQLILEETVSKLLLLRYQ